MKLTNEQAQKMDLVLTYLLKNDKARVKSKQVQELLKISLDEAHHIYEAILKYHYDIEPVVSILNAENISSSPQITESFLNKGGFVEIYKQQKDQEIFTEAQITKEIVETKWIKWQRKTYWFTFIIAVLGFIMGLISMLFSLGVLSIK